MSRFPARHALRVSVALLVTCWTAPPASSQLSPFDSTLVPASDLQLDGPIHDCLISVHEITNLYFSVFLNDAEQHNELQNPGFGDENGANMLFRPAPLNTGDVGLVDGSSVDGIFDISRSLLTYSPGMPIGARYGVQPGKQAHPVTGMSWIGAVKFCNWATINHLLGLGERCYAEGPGAADWFPLTIGSEIGGSQQATYAARDLTDAERWALVRDHRGWRLPMDGGGAAVGSVNAVPRPFNEWYKAAAFDPAAPDVARTALPGSFEQHLVLPDHWIHGFGRDPLGNPDANFRASGDPFDDPDPTVIATTPAGYYDGTNHGGVFQTTDDANHFGLFDVSGNVWEFLTDQVTVSTGPLPDRAIAGGSYRSNTNQVTPSNRGDIGPTTTRPVVGLRVLRVPTAPAFEDLGGGTTGSAGAPRLVGLGPLTPGSSVALELRRAPPGAFTLGWLAFQSLPQAFFGGTIHAIPFTRQFLFVTSPAGADPAGALSLATAWPPGVPPGTQLWIQFLIQDLSVLHGITLSNAIRGTTP